VGDSPTDMEFAHNSGALAVGVLSGVGSREELKGMADILIPSVDVLDQLEAIYTGKTTEWKAIYR
jgi:phosphoglycolate phosphatase-like HAD superfamily hydrolase